MNSSAALTEDQVNEFQGILGEIKTGWAELKPVPATLKTLQDDTAQLQQQVELSRYAASALHERTAYVISFIWPQY